MSDSLWPHGIVHGILQARILEWVAIPFSRRSSLIFPTQGSNPSLPHSRRILYQLSHQGRPRILEWVAYPFSRGSSQLRNQTGVSCIAGTFFTSWATREVPILTDAALIIGWVSSSPENLQNEWESVLTSQLWIKDSMTFPEHLTYSRHRPRPFTCTASFNPNNWMRY